MTATRNSNGGPAEPSLVRVADLRVHYRAHGGGLRQGTRGVVRAVDGVSFEIPAGTTLGLVGESGCGKTSTGRATLLLRRPTGGSVMFMGRELTQLTRTELRIMRQQMQIIFQDPYGSLNPKLTIGRILAEPFELRGIARNERKENVARLLDMVGLSPGIASRYPHEFSGGQRQRIGIARALASRPKFIVCDEPVSSLDVSIQAQILNLLVRLQRELGVAYLLISHDLAVVNHMAPRIAVMYIGKIVELLDSEELESAVHPYTRTLLSAVPRVDNGHQVKRERIVLKGELPSPHNPPQGCRFHTRCPLAEQRCREHEPELTEVAPGHTVACHRWAEIVGDGWSTAMAGTGTR